MVDKRLKGEIPYNERYNIDLDKFVDCSVYDWELSVRTENCLKSECINMQSQLLKMSEENLLNIKNFGLESLKEIKGYIKSLTKDQKVENNDIVTNSYLIPENLKKYVNDLIDDDLEEIRRLSLSNNEQEFLDRFIEEAPLIDKSLRTEAYLCSNSVIDIAVMLRSYIYNNNRNSLLRVKFLRVLNNVGNKRLELYIEPFLQSFGNEELKKLY